jgi:hypothetical protein
MWRSAIKATQDNAPLMAVVLPPINEVIDLHSTHLAMARRHLPVPIMAVLLGTAAIGVGMIGFGNGRVGRRFSVLDSVYGVVLAVALWMTIDLDSPYRGNLGCNELSMVAWRKRPTKIRVGDQHQKALGLEMPAQVARRADSNQRTAEVRSPVRCRRVPQAGPSKPAPFAAPEIGVASANCALLGDRLVGRQELDILWADAWPGPLARLRCLRISLRADDDATLDEVLVTIKSELVKLGPHIALDPNQLLEGAENRSPVTVNGSEPEAISPLRRRSPGMGVSSA